MRRARYGYVLALHLLLLGAAGRTPSEIAAVLFCARSSVDRGVKASRAGPLTVEDSPVAEAGQGRLRLLTPSRKRSVVALLKTVPRPWGGWRPRGSWAPLALEVHARRGGAGSAEPLRGWRPERGWVGKRAKLVAKAADPQPVAKRARRR